MRRFLAALAVGFALFAGSPGARAEWVDNLSSLRSDLASRQANDYTGTLDKIQKKELKALGKSIAAIDKPAAGFGDHVKTYGTLAKELEKAFPAQFGLGIVAPPLDLMMEALAQDLFGEVEADFFGVFAAFETLSAKGQAKLAAILTDAEAAFSGLPENATHTARAAAFAALAKALDKSRKVIASDKGPDVISSITVDGVAFKPGTLAVVYSETPGLLVFTAAKAGNPARTLSVTPASVKSVGNYNVSVGSWTVAQVPLRTYMLTNGGSFNVTSLNTEANLIAFDFDFTAPGQLGSPGSVEITGSYSGPYVQGD